MLKPVESVVLLNCLYQSNWFYIIISQWLKYRAGEPQIMSSNPQEAFVHLRNKIFENHNFISKIKCIFFADMTNISLIHHLSIKI